MTRRYDQPTQAWFRRQVIDLQTGDPAKKPKIHASLAQELLPVLRRIALTQQRHAWLGAYSWELSEDAVSHAYAQFLRRLGNFQEPYDIVSWCRRVMRNYLNEERNRRNRLLFTEEDFLFDNETYDEVNVLSVAHQVREAVKYLPKNQRIIIYLHYWEERTVKELAAHYGVTHQAITNVLQRARSKLKTMLLKDGVKNAGWADARTS